MVNDSRSANFGDSIVRTGGASLARPTLRSASGENEMRDSRRDSRWSEKSRITLLPRTEDKKQVSTARRRTEREVWRDVERNRVSTFSALACQGTGGKAHWRRVRLPIADCRLIVSWRLSLAGLVGLTCPTQRRGKFYTSGTFDPAASMEGTTRWCVGCRYDGADKTFSE